MFKRIGILLGSILAIFLVAFTLLYMQSGDANDQIARTIEISPGESASSVAAKLVASEIIKSRGGWLLALRLTGGENRIQAGKYLLSPSQTYLEIILALTQGEVMPPELLKVTFPEGESIYKMGVQLEKAKYTAWPNFQELVSSHIATELQEEFIFLKDIPTRSLEGYLFPDTYKMDPNLSVQEVVRMMVDRFTEVVIPVWEKNRHRTKFSLHELLTLASIVEKEAQIPGERPVIASVYLNRLRIGMKLDADPTVKYALENPQKVVRLEDLKVDSPYNTYTRAGLPPGPICNPGIESIRAVLFPAATDFLFFVADSTGKHIFSKTHEEHLMARRRIQ